MTTSIPRFPLTTVHSFVRACYEAMGVEPDRADLAAENLLSADLYGMDTHGIARFTYYADRITRGLIDVDTELTVVHETPSSLVLDANNGIAQVLAPQAMERCIAKANESGVCMTSIRHSNHFGMAGYYVRQATDHNLGAIAMTISAPLVMPTFGRQAEIGTNPIAFGVPTRDGNPILLDISTSAISWGKLENARRDDQQIPEGWAADSEGNPTTDPHHARHLKPLGGDRETGGQKGYGLAIMVDVLCAALSGGHWSGSLTDDERQANVANICHSFIAWRIDSFVDNDLFLDGIEEMTRSLRTSPAHPASGSDGILIPGDPEHEAAEINAIEGIPIRIPVLQELRALSVQLEVEFPFVY